MTHTSAGSQPILLARGLEKRYGQKPALADVSLTVQAGEIVALLGRNGAGKTTFASIVAGLIHPDAGQLQLDGIDALRHPQRARRALGFAPQVTGVYEPLTVEQNLVLFAELAGLRHGAVAQRVCSVCDRLLLGELRQARCQELSGGEKRRVHTAIALINAPRLLLLDEPTLGADITTRLALLDAVKSLAAEGSAIVYTTHYLPEVEELGASVAILERGRLIAQGTLAEVIEEAAISGLELSFEGEPPPLSIPGLPVERSANVLRFITPDPPTALARIVGKLGADLPRLRSVEVLRPNLDSAFLTLTGRRYEPEEPVDVAS